MLCEIEIVVNSRPLTYLYEEADEALTPSHLAIGRSLLNKSINHDEATEYSQGLLCNRFRYLQSVIQHYWKRFSKEYLIQLHEHHIYTRCKKHDEVNQLLLNDVVLIRDDSLKRNMWRNGKVKKIVKGWKNPWSVIESVSWRVHSINS